MHTLKYVILIVFIAYSQPIYTMQALAKKQKEIADQLIHTAQTTQKIIKITTPQLGTRSLIIIFDCETIVQTKAIATNASEKQICTFQEAMRDTLKAALKGKTPIIVSYWLLHWLLQFTETCPEPPPKSFDINYWYIFLCPNPTKMKTDPMAILIPKKGSYGVKEHTILEQYYNDIRDQKTINTKAIQEVELITGIRISKLDLIINKESLSPATRSSCKLKEFLETILITRSYLKNRHINTDLLNCWDVYLTGHGRSGDKIANLEIDEFKSVLKFFNTQLCTRSFLYDSCYTGGQNLQKPYQYEEVDEKGEKINPHAPAEQDKIKQITQWQDFNFTIIVGTVLDRAINEVEISYIDFEAYFTDLNKYFSKFNSQQKVKKGDFSEFTKQRPNDLLSIVIQHIFKNAFYDASYSRLQIPAIRFPHTEWFSIINIKNIFSLNNSAIIKAITSQQDKISGNIKVPEKLNTIIDTLKISGNITVPKNTAVIIAEARYIPIPITITNSMPLIFPKDTGINTDYFFKEIKLENIDLADFKVKIQDFFKMAPKQLFVQGLLNIGKWYIETLITKDHKDQPLRYVIIDPANAVMGEENWLNYEGHHTKNEWPKPDVLQKILDASNFPTAIREKIFQSQLATAEKE